jgi:hypothetical protein
MAIEDISIYNYVRDPQQLYDNVTIQRFLSAIAAQGYRLVSEIEQSDYFHVWFRTLYGTKEGAEPLLEAASQLDLETVFTPGISLSLQEEIRLYIEEQRPSLSFNVYSTEREGLMEAVDFSLALMSEEGQVYISIEDRHFTVLDSQRGIATYERWLETLSILYAAWHPLYGFDFDYSATRPDTTCEEALALDIHDVYYINIFGPEVVDKLGRERALTAPAWRIQQFEDGGVLLIPVLLYDPHETHEREDVAEYLGLATQ